MKENNLPEQIIASKIFEIRNEKVMMDADLAELYGVETRVLNQAVKRNENRFPDDFMFTLTKKEWDDLKSQIVTSSWGGRRKLPRVFTEQGVAMLSSVLGSETAIAVNIIPFGHEVTSLSSNYPCVYKNAGNSFDKQRHTA